ncbi:MAG: glycosyltransferase 87 family protein [Thermoanaerobaculia bacterium]
MQVSKRLLLAIFGLGLGSRLLLVVTSIGTNDVPFMILWAKLIRQHGIAGSYARMWELNHPPLAMLMFSLLDSLAGVTGLEFTDLLRVAQVIAEGVTATCLLILLRRHKIEMPIAAYYLLCPAAIFISGFHCNTDATMLAFLMVGVLALSFGMPFLAGIAVACSVGIKIIPLFLVPLFLLAARREWWRVASGFAIAFSTIFVPVALLAGPSFVRNVFGYSGFSGKWGFPALLLWSESLIAEPRTTLLYKTALLYAQQGKYLVVAAVVALLLLAWRRLNVDSDPILWLGRFIPLILLAVLIVAPGYGVQYLIWPLPLLPLLLPPRTYAATILAVSAYVFLTYTTWAEGFPWGYADSVAQTPGKSLLIPLGLVLWIFLAWAAWRGWQSHEHTESDSAVRT